MPEKEKQPKENLEQADKDSPKLEENFRKSYSPQADDGISTDDVMNGMNNQLFGPELSADKLDSNSSSISSATTDNNSSEKD